jgi:hypothetical protein
VSSPVAGFDEPFYTGPLISTETGRYPVAINGRGYFIDQAKYKRMFIDQLRPPSDQSEEVGESSINPLGLWRRGTTDWSLGAGQALFDGPTSDRARFSDSRGIDVWDRHVIKLHHDTELKEASAETVIHLLEAGANLYVSLGEVLKRTTDATPASPTMTTITGLPGGANDVTGLAATGEHIYVAAGNDLYRGSLGAGSVASWYSATDVRGVWYVNGRLLVTRDNVIAELSAAAAETILKTHNQASFDWVDVVGTPNGIFAAGHDGINSEIYSVRVNADTGALGAFVVAAPLPRSELVNAIEFYGGLLFIGTDKGVRTAQVGDDATLTYGPLIEVGAVNDFAVDGQFVWFSWYDGSVARLGRLSPSTFTEPLVPAYASDLEANLDGITPGSFEVGEVARFEGRTYFGLTGTGWFGETSTYMAEGTLNTGTVRYGILDPKLIINFDYRMKPLPDGASVTFSVGFDDDTRASLTPTTQTGARGPTTPQTLDHTPTETADPRIILGAGTAELTTPELTRWVMKAHPTPEMVQQILVPVILRTRVETEKGEGGQVEYYDVRAEVEYLKGLVRDQRIVTYQEGDVGESCVVMNIELQAMEWNLEVLALEGTCLVQLKTIE